MFLPTEVFLRTQQATILSEEVVSRALARLDGAKTQEAITTAAEEIRRHGQTRLRRQIKHIKVTTPVGQSFSNSEVFYINVEVPDTPARAQELTNLVAEEYLTKFNAIEGMPLSRSTQILQAEVQTLKDEVDQANARLAMFISNTIQGDFVALRAIASAGTPLAGVSVTAEIDKEIKTLRADLKEAIALKAELDKELARVAQLTARDPLDIDNIPVVPERVLADNPSISALAGRLTDQRLRAIELEPRYTEDFRERQNVAKEIDLTSTLLRKSLANVSTSLGQEINTIQARIDELSDILEKDQAYLKKLSGQYVEYSRLLHERTSAQDEYKAKEMELKQAQSAESAAERQVYLVQLDTASLPSTQVRPILWANTLLGVIVAVLFAVAYCFIGDYLDHRFKTVEQAEQYLDLPVLGSVRDLGRRIIYRK